MVIEEISREKKHHLSSVTSKKALRPVHLYTPSNGSQIPEISVIMPAFNEEKAVGSLIDRTEKILQRISPHYEIIVIDDGSNDQTLDICQEKYVKIIHNHYNSGKGYALREGFRHARGKYVVTLDSDGDHHPDEIPLLLAPLMKGHVDVVLGTRFVENQGRLITSAINTFGNKLFNFLIRCLTNQQFTDTQCGFRAFHQKVLKNLTFTANGYSIETEMLITFSKKRIKMQEIPISSPVTYNRKSNLNRIRDGLSILFTIFKSRLK